MRPPGQIRPAALRAAERVVQQQRAMHRQAGSVHMQVGATWRDVAELLVPQGVAVHAVRHTWKNLTRTPLLQRVGPVQVPGAQRAMVAYVPCVQPSDLVSAADPAPLANSMRAWVACR